MLVGCGTALEAILSGPRALSACRTVQAIHALLRSTCIKAQSEVQATCETQTVVLFHGCIPTDGVKESERPIESYETCMCSVLW